MKEETWLHSLAGARQRGRFPSMQTRVTLYTSFHMCCCVCIVIIHSRRYVEESFVWKVFYQVLLALEECHKKRSGVHKVSPTFPGNKYAADTWCQLICKASKH